MYEEIVKALGSPSNATQENIAYICSAVVLLLGCYCCIKIVGWLFKW